MGHRGAAPRDIPWTIPEPPNPLRDFPQAQPGEKQLLLFVPGISLIKFCFNQILLLCKGMGEAAIAGVKQGLSKGNSLILTPESELLKPRWRCPQSPPDSALGLFAALIILSFPFLFSPHNPSSPYPEFPHPSSLSQPVLCRIWGQFFEQTALIPHSCAKQETQGKKDQ